MKGNNQHKNCTAPGIPREPTQCPVINVDFEMVGFICQREKSLNDFLLDFAIPPYIYIFNISDIVLLYNIQYVLLCIVYLMYVTYIILLYFHVYIHIHIHILYTVSLYTFTVIHTHRQPIVLVKIGL